MCSCNSVSSKTRNHNPTSSRGKTEQYFLQANPVFLLQDITVITRATACIPETLLGISLSRNEEDKMVETSDVLEKELKEENMMNAFLDFGEISAKEISFTIDRNDGFGEVNTDMYAVHGLIGVIGADTDNNVLETNGMNDSLVDTREISDIAKFIAPEVGSDVMERINEMQSTSLVSQNTSCLLESHL